MRKIILVFTFLFINVLYFSCSPYFTNYFTENGGVYYGGDSHKEKLENVDKKTFKIINVYYAKDKNSVYYNGVLLNGVNPEKFEFLGGISTLIGEDGYVKDDKNIYFLGKKMENVDLKTFKVVKSNISRSFEGYAKDENKVYFQAKPLLGIDVETFEIIGEAYTKDKNGVYYANEKLEGVDSQNYTKNDNFIKSNGIIYENEKKQAYDYKTFTLIKTYISNDSCGGTAYMGSLVKDKDGIYYNGEKISNVDSKTFELVKDNLFKDKNGYYYEFENNKMKNINIDPKTSKMYKIESGIIIKDQNNIYRISFNRNLENLKEIKIDPATFELYAVIEGITLFKDKNAFYETDWININRVEINSKKSKLLFYNSELIVLKDEKSIYLGSMHSSLIDAKDEEIDINTFSFVRKNDILKKAGINTGVFIDKNGFYYDNVDKIRTITDEEYKKLKEFVVPEKEFDEERKLNLEQKDQSF